MLDRLREAGFDLDVRETAGDGDGPSAGDLATQGVAERFEAILVAGGDGTVQKVAKKLIDTKIILGILPFGSYMNIANGLGISLDPLEAVETICQRQVVDCDVGEVAGEVFFETAGVGIDADVFGAARLAEKKKFGKALRRLARGARQGSHRISITVDGREYTHRVVQLLVANSPYYLWSFAIAPDARMDDGLLEVAVYARMGRLKLLRALFGLWRNGESPYRPITYRGKKIELKSREKLPVHADGDLVGKLPLMITCKSGAVKVFAPKTP